MKKDNFGKATTRKENKRTKSKNHTDRTKLQLPQIKKEILSNRQKQSRLLNQIKDDIKKIRENNISITGLEQISSGSIQTMQERRKKFLTQMSDTVYELSLLLKTITNLETKYKHNL